MNGNFQQWVIQSLFGRLSYDFLGKTENDVQLALTGIYSYMLTSTAFNHARKLWDGLSDVAVAHSGITIGNVDATNGGIWGIYTNCYVIML